MIHLLTSMIADTIICNAEHMFDRVRNAALQREGKQESDTIPPELQHFFTFKTHSDSTRTLHMILADDIWIHVPKKRATQEI